MKQFIEKLALNKLSVEIAEVSTGLEELSKCFRELDQATSFKMLCETLAEIQYHAKCISTEIRESFEIERVKEE